MRNKKELQQSTTFNAETLGIQVQEVVEVVNFTTSSPVPEYIQPYASDVNTFQNVPTSLLVQWEKEKKQETVIQVEDEPSPTASFESVTNENAAERERVIESVIQDAGFSVHTSLPDNGYTGTQFRIFEGLQTASNRKSNKVRGLFMASEALIGVELTRPNRIKFLVDNNAEEYIAIFYPKKDIFTTEDYAIPGKKGGLFGIGATPDIKGSRDVLVGNRPLTHAEIVSNGKDEPSVLFEYIVSTKDWEVPDGRDGQMFAAVFVLPNSTAEQLKKQFQSDTTIMREISKRLLSKYMSTKISKGHHDKAWIPPRFDSKINNFLYFDQMVNKVRVVMQHSIPKK